MGTRLAAILRGSPRCGEHLRMTAVCVAPIAPQKPKDPPGGTTGRVKLYGRWGGWALAPYTALSGRDNRSRSYWSRHAPGRSKPDVNFFKLLHRDTDRDGQ